MNITLAGMTCNLPLLLLFVGLLALFAWRFSDLPRRWLTRGKQDQTLVQASQTWQTTHGKIISSQVGTSARSMDRRSPPKYYPELTYEYVVDEHTYRGERRGIGGEIGLAENAARDIVARYPAGAAVTVYYDPAQPSEALLERAVTGLQTKHILVPFLIGAAILAAGLLFVVWWMSERGAP